MDALNGEIPGGEAVLEMREDLFEERNNSGFRSILEMLLQS